MRDKVTEMHGLFILLSVVCLVKSDIDEVSNFLSLILCE